MGTLYVASAPAGDPDDAPFRLQRTLRDASLVAATDPSSVQPLLDQLGVTTPLVSTAPADGALDALAMGDVVLLLEGTASSPPPAAQAVIEAALARGHPVLSLPGPTLPVTALVASGLPADSFVYLGLMPEQPSERSELIACVASEQRTLVAVAQGESLPQLLAELCAALGDRPMAVLALGDAQVRRGRLAHGLDAWRESTPRGPCGLVIGGASGQITRWDEGRLRMEIGLRLDRGAEAKEIARQLASESGWARREIYRLAVRAAARGGR